jgi:hypothetical protein
MVTAIVLSFLLMAACLVIAVLLFRGTDPVVDRVLAEIAPEAPASYTTPSTSAPVASAPSRVATAAGPLLPALQTRIRLVSKGGTLLGETSVTKRRVGLQQRVGKAQALCNFVASHKEDDVWVYRQVGTERE